MLQFNFLSLMFLSVKFSNFNCIIEDSSERQVWMIGSSIIKRALNHARNFTIDGENLGLERRYGKIQWYGEGGMRWADLMPKIKWLLKNNSPPQFLVIHCSGNDLGFKNLNILRYRIKLSILAIHKMMPSTTIVWSQVLPRLKWRRSVNSKAMNLAAVRINSFAASLIG